jgi:hypothetical protein
MVLADDKRPEVSQVLELSRHAFLFHNIYWQIMDSCQSVFGEVAKKSH